MQMLYNSDSFTVVEFDFGQFDAISDAVSTRRGGYEIVDKFARKEIFIDGAVAESFKQGVAALVERGPTEQEFDDFIAGYTALAQHPMVLH